MITWDKNLRYDTQSEGKIARIKRRLRWRRTTSLLNYCITYSVNGKNLMDIYNMSELIFKYYCESDADVHIIGLASSKESAIEIVGDIVNEVYAKTGGFDIRGYFEAL